MKHVVLYVGHMYKPFWTKKIWPGWQEGPGKVKIWHIWVISMGNVQKWTILTFPYPPCQPGQIFWVQNGLYMCPTYSSTCFMSNSHLWGYFRPSEVRFRAKIPLSSHWFYNVKTQKTRFLKKSPIKLADFLYIHSLWCPQPPCQILQMALSRVGLVV